MVMKSFQVKIFISLSEIDAFTFILVINLNTIDLISQNLPSLRCMIHAFLQRI